MRDWTKDPIAVRLLTGKDEPETIYTFTAADWYEQRKAWMAQGKCITEERIIKLLEAFSMAWSDDCAVPVDWKHCQNCWQFASLIARIKGEK